jgi:hypothetical protein
MARMGKKESRHKNGLRGITTTEKKCYIVRFTSSFLLLLLFGLNNQTTHVSEFFFSSRNTEKKVGRCIPRRNRLATERVRGTRSPVQRGSPDNLLWFNTSWPDRASSSEEFSSLTSSHWLASRTPLERWFPPSTLHTTAVGQSAKRLCSAKLN